MAKIRNRGNSVLVSTGDFLAVDVETDGGPPDTGRLIEIGAARYVAGKRTETFSELINPEDPITEFIENLTGITNSMLAGAPSENDVVRRFVEFIGGEDGGTLTLAHNANFDMSFLSRAAFRNCGFYLMNDFIDTLRVARRVLKGIVPNFQLGTIARHYSIDPTGAHRALFDAEMAAECYLRMIGFRPSVSTPPVLRRDVLPFGDFATGGPEMREPVGRSPAFWVTAGIGEEL